VTIHHINIFIIAVCASLLSACSLTPPIAPLPPPKQYASSVDSLALPDAATKKKYSLLPGNKNVEVSDLQFQEFAKHVECALADRGFKKASNVDDAQVAIFLSYGIGDPETYQFSYAVPVWGQTGIESSTTNAYTGKTTYTPSYGIAAYRTESRAFNTYTRFLNIETYDVPALKHNEKMLQVWKTSVVSTGSSNDLREVFPYMVAAMRPFLAQNPGRKLNTTVSENSVNAESLCIGQ
jgi:hypothetical protein